MHASLMYQQCDYHIVIHAYFYDQSHKAVLVIHLWPPNHPFHGWPQVALEQRRQGKEAQWS